jgi:hypothetical protein
MREKDWRCRARVTPARSPWRAHVACVPRLRQRQSFLRTHTLCFGRIGGIITPNSHRLLQISSNRLMASINRFCLASSYKTCKMRREKVCNACHSCSNAKMNRYDSYAIGHINTCTTVQERTTPSTVAACQRQVYQKNMQHQQSHQ